MNGDMEWKEMAEVNDKYINIWQSYLIERLCAKKHVSKVNIL